jgi:FKBP-type peptidyl-prolyl cis-trans isomerase 2
MEKGDFVLLEMEGRDSSGQIFDSTKGETAKSLHGKEGPLLIIYGYAVMVKGINDALGRMKEGDSLGIALEPKDAFGDRKPEKVKVYPVSEFIKAGYKSLAPGMVMVINVPAGKLTGTIKSISNGRVTVDFNHPLAGKKVFYDLKIAKVIRDTGEKVPRLCEALSIAGSSTVDEKGKKITVTVDGDKEGNKGILYSNLELLFPGYKREINDAAGKDKGTA